MSGADTTQTAPRLPAATAPLELSYAPLASEQLAAPSSEHVRLLQHAADYRYVTTRLRILARGGIVLGAIMSSLAVAGFDGGIVPRPFLQIAGPVTLIAGVWARIAPSTWAKFSDSIDLLIPPLPPLHDPT